MYHGVFNLLPQSVELCFEDLVLIVKGEHVGSRDGDLEDGYLRYTHVPAYIYLCGIGQFFLDAIVDIGLEDLMTDAQPPQFR